MPDVLITNTSAFSKLTENFGHAMRVLQPQLDSVAREGILESLTGLDDIYTPLKADQVTAMTLLTAYNTLRLSIEKLATPNVIKTVTDLAAQFEQVFTENGLTLQIPKTYEKFDPNQHEATGNIHVDQQSCAGTVAFTAAAGLTTLDGQHVAFPQVHVFKHEPQI